MVITKLINIKMIILASKRNEQACLKNFSNIYLKLFIIDQTFFSHFDSSHTICCNFDHQAFI